MNFGNPNIFELMETLKGLGKLSILTDRKIKSEGKGSKKIKEFLDKLVLGFAKHSAKYINTLNEAPFIFKERQLNSILAPVFSKIGDAFVTEHPMKRKNLSLKMREAGKKSYSGWIDYWARCGDFDFYIEVKHDYDAFNTEPIRLSALRNWKNMWEQLNGIKKEAKSISEQAPGIYLVSLHVIVIYDFRKLHVEENPEYDVSDLIGIQEKYFDNLSTPSPKWSGMWILHDELVKTCRWESETHVECYPAVMFFSKFENIK